ncbi:fumarylacetoacetate hydrolase family protein [Shinella sp. CPCC 100929]|uniref:Fumarylacetoacetate hydrolase family protein n=1 Tax=Shinella lacus TaxID=2654216 RepID=A0ABT1RHJ7_9HYPH|nr:fumarylacetoacetate hydrolase family protein [Shinella lacus]
MPLSAIPDPHKLRIQTRLNGKVMQDSTTDLMIFDHVVSFLSTYVTLQPGGIICTGTPGYRVRGRNIVNPVPAPLAIGGNAADPDGFLLWASFL